MPTIKVKQEDLWKIVGEELSREELEDILFMLKSELEGWVDELEVSVDDSERPDLWSAEGMGRAVRQYIREEGVWSSKVNDSSYELVNEGPRYRPYILAAVVKGVRLGEEGLEQLIQLQEKIMLSYGRKRKVVAIGTSDLDKMRFPLRYTVVEEVRFIPLGDSREMSLEEVLEKTEKGREYAHLVRRGEYPVILDADDNVVTFPPIINSDTIGRVTEDTRNIFIDVTGTDMRRVEVALNVMVSALVERGGEVYAVYVNGERYPRLEPRFFPVPWEKVYALGGVKGGESHLKKMGYDVTQEGVLYPSYRGDIFHWQDVLEDMLSGMDYNTLEPLVFDRYTRGRLNEVSRLTRAVRELMVGAGFTEVQTFTLSDPEVHRDFGFEYFVRVINAVSGLYSVLRPSVIPHLVRALSLNTDKPYPQRVFEVGEVYREGKTYIALSAAIAGHGRTYTDMRRVLDFVAKKMEWKIRYTPLSSPGLLEGRTARVEGDVEGVVGEVDIPVLHKYRFFVPVVVMEVLLTSR